MWNEMLCSIEFGFWNLLLINARLKVFSVWLDSKQHFRITCSLSYNLIGGGI